MVEYGLITSIVYTFENILCLAKCNFCISNIFIRVFKSGKIRVKLYMGNMYCNNIIKENFMKSKYTVDYRETKLHELKLYILNI